MTAFTLNKKILFVSTFPPKKCGIASFTKDLIHAINSAGIPKIIIEACALDKKSNSLLYKYPVNSIMNPYKLDSCIETALAINQDDDVKLICIEHEFGLYGGELGEYLLGFLSMLEKPFIIRFHTMLSHPSAKMLGIVKAIALLATKIIVMTRHSARVIKEDYGISANKIIIIPHGIHANSIVDKDELKIKYNLQNKQVFTTFGLLSDERNQCHFS